MCVTACMTQLGSKIIREKDRHQAQSEKMQAQLLQDAAFSAKASW